jgi:endo-1,4-beta-xylanase
VFLCFRRPVKKSTHLRELSRRDSLRLLGGGMAAVLAGGLSLRADDTEPAGLPSLRDLAAAKGLKFGSDTDIRFADAPEAYRRLFTQQCGLFAAGLAWKYTEPQPGVHDFAGDQSNVDFARDQHLLLTGVHFLWHEELPDWFVDLKDPKKAADAARGHIETMCRTFRGQAWSWNVVNEAIDNEACDRLRDSPLLKNLGPDFIAEAFQWAAGANSEALLVYNDYGFESGDKAPIKRKFLLQLLDDLLAKKAPIGAVGLQSHLKVGEPFDSGAYHAFLRDLAARNLPILITELDALDRTADPIAQQDRQVADTYRRFLDVALSEPAVKQVVVWGLCDKYSWYNSPDRDEDFARADKTPARPLLFNADLKPKPVFDIIVSALQNAPAR